MSILSRYKQKRIIQKNEFLKSKMKGTKINFSTSNAIMKIVNPENITIGNNVSIVGKVEFYAQSKIAIGNNVIFANNTVLLSRIHEYAAINALPYSTDYQFGEIIIEDDVSFGFGVTVLPGVRIGMYTHIGPNAVVFDDVPSGSIVMGNPAKVVLKRNMDEYNFCKKHGKPISSIRASNYFNRSEAFEKEKIILKKTLNNKNIIYEDNKILKKYGKWSASLLYEYSVFNKKEVKFILTTKGYAIAKIEHINIQVDELLEKKIEINSNSIREYLGINLSEKQIMELNFKKQLNTVIPKLKNLDEYKSGAAKKRKNEFDKELKNIIAKYLKIKPYDIDDNTIIDKTKIEGSILLYRMISKINEKFDIDLQQIDNFKLFSDLRSIIENELD